VGAAVVVVAAGAGDPSHHPPGEDQTGDRGRSADEMLAKWGPVEDDDCPRLLTAVSLSVCTSLVVVDAAAAVSIDAPSSSSSSVNRRSLSRSRSALLTLLESERATTWHR